MKRLRSSFLLTLIVSLQPQLFSQTIHWESMHGPNITERFFHFVYPDGERIVVGSLSGVFRWSGGDAGWERAGDLPATTPPDEPLAPPYEVLSDDSGRLYLFAEHPYQSPYPKGQLIYVYRSTDRGRSWKLLTSSIRLELALSDGDTVYRLAGQSDIILGYVYFSRSTDAGLSWMTLGQGTQSSGFVGLSVQYGNVFLEMYDDTMIPPYPKSYTRRSSDGGASWQYLGGTCPVVYTPPDKLLLIRDSLMFSGDNGHTWRMVLQSDSTFFNPISNGNGVVLVSSRGSKQFRSLDGGGSWTEVTGDASGETVTAKSFSGPRTLIGTSASRDFYYRSSDFGQSWQLILTPSGVPLSGGLEKSLAELLVVSMDNPDSTAWYESHDTGMTWVHRTFRPFRRTQVTSLMVHSSGRLLAGASDGLFLQNWEGSWGVLPLEGPVWAMSQWDSGYTFVGTGVHGLEPLRFNGTLYRMTPSLNDWTGVLGGGRTWTNSTPDFGAVVCLSDSEVIAGMGSKPFYLPNASEDPYSWRLWSGPNSPVSSFVGRSMGYIFAGTRGAGIYRTMERGTSWVQKNAGLTDLEVHSLAENGNGDLFAGTGNGVFRSTDLAENWEPVGLAGRKVQALAVDSWGRLFAGTIGWPHVSTDNGKTWIQIHEGLTNYDITSVVVGRDGAVSCGTWGDGVYRLVEDGGSWPALLSPANNARKQDETTKLVWRTARWGQTYRVQMATASDFGSGAVLDHGGLTDTTITVDSLERGTTYHWRIRVSNQDGPLTWSKPYTFRTLLPLPAKVILASPSSGAEVHADTVRLSWGRSTPEVTRYWIEVATDSLFAFRTVDSNATTTTNLIRGLQNAKRYWWMVRAYNEAGWGGFSDASQFSVTITGVDTSDLVPTEYAVRQNFPNPFNPSTTIKYELPKSSMVRLSIYDMLGREVSVLVSEKRDAGVHQVRFDASGLSSGVYFCRLQAGGFIQVRKLLLVR